MNNYGKQKNGHNVKGLFDFKHKHLRYFRAAANHS